MITTTRQIIRQDMGDLQSPMPLCRRVSSYTIAFCYASSYYNSLPIFFQYLVFHLLTTEDCLFHNTGFATLDKGKHDKQQKNGLSTLPKTPPGCKKGGVFA